LPEITSVPVKPRDYDLRIVQHAYQEGDLVYKLDSSSKIGQSSKLRSPWMGPFLVIGSRPPLYRIQGKKKEYVVHHDRLKRCHERHIPLWLRRLRHDLFNTTMPNLEQSGIDPDETLPYCDSFPLLGLSSLDGPDTGKKDVSISNKPCLFQKSSKELKQVDSLLGQPAPPSEPTRKDDPDENLVLLQDCKDSQWGPADEQTDDDNSIKQADPTDFQVPDQDADKSLLGREAPPEAQDGDTVGVSTKGRTIRKPSHLRDYVS